MVFSSLQIWRKTKQKQFNQTLEQGHETVTHFENIIHDTHYTVHVMHLLSHPLIHAGIHIHTLLLLLLGLGGMLFFLFSLSLICLSVVEVFVHFLCYIIYGLVNWFTMFTLTLYNFVSILGLYIYIEIIKKTIKNNKKHTQHTHSHAHTHTHTLYIYPYLYALTQTDS